MKLFKPVVGWTKGSCYRCRAFLKSELGTDGIRHLGRSRSHGHPCQYAIDRMNYSMISSIKLSSRPRQNTPAIYEIA